VAGPLSPIVGLQSTFLEPQPNLIFAAPAPGVTQAWLPDQPARRRLMLPVRRSHVASPPAQTVSLVLIAAPGRRRPTLPPQRRQRGAAALQAPVVMVLQTARARRWMMPNRRPRSGELPWPQAVPPVTPNPAFTDWTRRRVPPRGWPPVPRGRVIQPPWPQAVQAVVPPPPAQAPRRRPQLLWRRRGALFAPPAPLASSPPLTNSRRKTPTLPARRGRAHQPPWPQAIQPPPPLLVDRFRRARWKLPLWPRRARSVWVFPFVDPTVLRDVDLITYPPRSRWSFGTPFSRIRTGTPFTRWSAGPPEDNS
jgi:hypothetical protein